MAAAALVLWSVQAAAREPQPTSRTGEGPHVRVELIADRAEAGPGITLGLKFDLDPGWHIYWLNPGDSGGPPEVFWTLPEGMATAEIAWPTPERINVGGLVNYGYHGPVVLPVPVNVTTGSRVAGRSAVKAAVRWMACANLCVPGKAELALSFPLSAEEARSVGSWKADIDAALSRVPKPAPASWSASAASTADRFVLDVMTGSPEEVAVFFPLEVSEVNDSADQRATALPNGVRLELRKSSQLVTDPQALIGVLALSGGRAYLIEARVR